MYIIAYIIRYSQCFELLVLFLKVWVFFICHRIQIHFALCYGLKTSGIN